MKRGTAAIILLVIILIVIGIMYRLSHTIEKKRVESDNINMTPITLAPVVSKAPVAEMKGSIKLLTQGQTVAFVPDDEITVLIEGSATNAGIVGYDVVIPYNPEIMSYVKTQSNDERFILVANQKNNTLVITGVKKPEHKDRVMLSNSVLATITFKALHKAHYSLTPLFGLNKSNDTNLMSESGYDIAGKVQGIDINIGTPVTVTKEKHTVIDGGLELALQETTTIPKNCADCMETTQLEVIRGNERQAISYRLGGFAGFHDNKQEAFNTLFILTKITDGGVSLIYVPKSN